MTTPSLLPKIEALLFVSGEPLTIVRLAKLLTVDRAEAEAALGELRTKYINDVQSGLMLIEDNGAVEIATKGDVATEVAAFTKSMLQEELSRPALEVLAIVAYRAPITRSEIEAIRGVNCSFTLRNLLLRGLVDRTDNPKDSREYLYHPTLALLEKLGIGKREELPDFLAMSQDERLTTVLDEQLIVNSTDQNLKTETITQ